MKNKKVNLGYWIFGISVLVVIIIAFLLAIFLTFFLGYDMYASHIAEKVTGYDNCYSQDYFSLSPEKSFSCYKNDEYGVLLSDDYFIIDIINRVIISKR